MEGRNSEFACSVGGTLVCYNCLYMCIGISLLLAPPLVGMVIQCAFGTREMVERGEVKFYTAYVPIYVPVFIIHPSRTGRGRGGLIP